MIGQGANAQAAEKKVIAGYNAKLVTRADAFKTANTGVSTPEPFTNTLGSSPLR